MAEYRFEDIAINSTEKKKPVESDKEHYLGLEHLDSGTFKVSRFGSEVAPIGDKLIMKKGDVLFGKRRAYQKKVAIAPFDGIFSAHGMVLRPKEDVIDKNFFPLFIASDYFLDAAIKISVGSLSPTINWRDLKELKFNLPELEEQKKLAEVLWQIVDTMESYKKLLAKTDEMVKAKFVEMFGDPFKNEKNIACYKGSDFLILSSGKSHNIDENSIYPCYGGNGITGYVKDYFVEKPTIVIGRVGAYCGNVTKTLEKSWITDNAIYIKEFKANIFDIDFLLQLFKFHDFHKLAEFCGQPKITQAPILNSTFICPELSQQKKYVNFVQNSEESKAATQSSLNSLSAVYKKIIAENLGGSN